MSYDWVLLIQLLLIPAALTACPVSEGYDISILNREVLTVYNSTSFYFNLCGNSPDSSSCRGQAGCYKTVKGDTIFLGDVTSTQPHDDFLNITLSQNNITTHIALLCGNSVGRPEVQHLSDSHVTVIWTSLAGCKNTAPQNIVPCYSYNAVQELYDMGDLVGIDYHIPVVDSKKSIYFSLCGPVTGDSSCQGGSACYKDENGTTNIGNVEGPPHVSAQDGGVVISYSVQDAASASCPEVTTTIVLICSPHQQTPPTLLYTNTSCTYSIVWRTEHACPVTPVHDVGCKLHGRGISYDLTPLTGKDFTLELEEHNYVVSVCGVISTGCSGEEASACVSDTESLEAWSMGSYHEGNLVLDDTGLTMIYTGGTQCSKGQVRSTKIVFVCDKSVDGLGAPEMTEKFYCFYSFIWRTKFACPTTQSNVCAKYGTDGELYDLSGLAGTLWRPTGGANDLVLKICGAPEKCPGASLCREASDNYEVLASTSEHFQINEDKSLVLTYEGLGTCESSPVSLTIELTCKQGSFVSTPVLVSGESCNYVVVWQTSAACPAHSTSGTECRLEDDITGLTFDVHSLAQQPWTFKMSGDSEISVQLCGSLSDKTCGEGVSVCRSDGTALGFADNGISSSSKLLYSSQSLAMSMTGADCEASLNYSTIVEFLCETDPNKKSFTGYKMGNCAYYITWSDPSVCPMFPVQCSVANGTHSTDLSPLYDSGNLEWSGLLGGTQTALYIRTCGQVAPGTEQCDHTAGICAVQEKNGKKVSLNVGRASSNLGLENGVIRETYINGDRVCLDTSLHAKTIVEYSCDKQTAVLQALFSDEQCLFVVVVATPHACVEDEVTTRSCTIEDPLSGLSYDFSHLTDDYEFSNVNSHFLLHVCGPLVDKTCGDNTDSGACEVVNGNYLSLGDSSTSTLSLNEGTFTLTYNGGDQCAGDSTSHRETQVTILCDRQTPLGTPKYLNKDSESCEYHFEWEMAAACPPKELLCSAIDSQLREYDLSVLRRETPWKVRSGRYTYFFNVCGASSMCEKDSAICRTNEYKPNEPPESLGRNTGEPIVRDDGSLELVYHHGFICHGTRRWITRIVFYCETEAESMPEITENDAQCEIRVKWRTLHACPAVYTTGENCTVTNPVTGVTYDLWKLSSQPFTTDIDEHQYKYSFCSPMSCNGQESTGSCQTGKATKVEKSLGQVNKTVTYSNGVIILHYMDGDVCSSGKAREMSINILCDHKLSDLELQLEKVQETSHCVYETVAFSGLPCDKEVLSQCEVQGYDISALALTRSNYMTTSNQFTFTLNICRSINPPSPCSGDAAICMREGVKSGISLGDVSSASLVYEDYSLKLKYTGADLCPKTGQAYNSVITFLCDPNNMEGVPEYLSNSTCTFHFLWKTKYACQESEVSDVCKIVGYLGDALVDLTSLKGVYSVIKPGSTDTYAVSLCQVLPNTQCKANTAVCLLTDQNSKYVSLGIGFTRLTRSGEGSVITATYDYGDMCTRADGSTIRYNTIMEFTCASTQSTSISLIGEEDCVVRMRFATPLACKEDKIACEVVKEGRTVDLSSISSFSQFLIAKKVALDGDVYLSICHSLPQNEAVHSCPSKSAACLLPLAGNPLSLGSISSPLQVSDDGNIELLYTRGSTCSTGGTYSTRITFVCDALGPSDPELIDISDCEYNIEWGTPLTCEEDAPLPVEGCKVTDAETNYEYDLTKLTVQDDDYYQTDGGVVQYTANICGSVENCGKDVAVCYNDNGKHVSLGALSSARTELAQQRGEVEIMYSGGDKTAQCPEGKSSKIMIMCCPSDENEMQLVSKNQDTCEYIFSTCSQYVCQFSPKECDFKIGGVVYDISPLARRHDNWKIVDNDRTFFMNPCRGVNLDSTLKGCTEGSIVCMKEASVLGSSSLGLIMSRVPDKRVDPGQVKVFYDGGSDQLCSDRTARTQILFSCGNTLGQPTFLEDSLCGYKFAWQSYVACNSSARPITSTSCSYQDPISGSEVDLGKTGHLVAEGDMFTVYLAPCDQLLGKDPEQGQCKGSSVCVKDTRNGRIVKFIANSKELFAREEAAELIIKSATPCEDSDKKSWKAIIEYSCGVTESATFRAMSHCHVLLKVETPLLCVFRSNGYHTSFLLVIVIVICGMSLACIMLYICTNPNRRHKMMRRIRSLIPVSGAASPNSTMAYKRLRMENVNDLLDSDEEIVGL